MAKCPACSHEIRTPFLMNLDAWSHLACPHCKARLEMKPPRSFLLAPLIAPLFVLARQGRIFEILAFVFMFATFLFVLLASLHPAVRLRKKPVPKPAITLDIEGPPK